ncbi:MAG: hypothetical protein IT423_24625 [Pirellulaceae bacterium]|nr:hypothetical protein [Pirellulaceae bacterium]
MPTAKATAQTILTPPAMSSSAMGQPSKFGLSFELRAVWGGGAVRSFAGKISISDGLVDVVRNLSVQDDAVATLARTSQSEIAIVPHSPSSFGGVDLLIKGNLDSELLIQFSEPGQPAMEPVRVTLRRLLQGREFFSIDARGSRLALERLTHDRLRARINQGQSILTSGDPCSLSVEGYQTGLAAGDYRVHVKLVEGATGRAVSQLHHDISLDDSGNFIVPTFKDIQLPARGGVYAFDISIQKRRLISSLMSTASLVDRRLEFVVTERSVLPGASSTDGDPTQWRSLAQIYPAGESWWDSLGKFRIPGVAGLPALVGQSARALSSTDHKRRLVGDEECMVLAKGAWQAFPLSVDAIGAPHRLRIRVPADAPQKLVFSIQEASPAADAGGLKLDSGMIVDAGAVAVGRFATHELVFWPKSTAPYLLVFNADSQTDAALAEISVDEIGEGGLKATSLMRATAMRRMCSLYMDKPLLAENFGAARRLDGLGQRELDSWRTVWEASERLAQYTAWSGFNTATVTIATQGGAIYPSKVWSPTHKFDSGTFLTDGACTDIKDWTELICRQFDRRGLKLVLALDVEGALPEIERYVTEAQPDTSARGAESLQAYYQVDMDGRPASTRLASGSSRNLLYNPTDARVQTALIRIVRELVERYGKHACFAGVQINLSERSHFNFAGDTWGYDAASITRFERSLGTALPKDEAERKRLISTTVRLDFLNERSQHLAEFYERLAGEVSQANDHARLIVNPAKLIATPPAADNFINAASQSLTASDILLGCGIDGNRLATIDRLTLLRPETDSPLRSPPARAWSFQLASDTELDGKLSSPMAGAIVQQLPTSFRLADFDKLNPLANDRSRTWLFPHATSAGDWARRCLVDRLFHADVQLLVSGGWLVPLGQEVSVRPLLNVLQAMPPQTMRDLKPKGISPALRVRRAQYAGETWLQFVNNASWSEEVVVQLQCAPATRVRQLTGSSDTANPTVVSAGEPTTIKFMMPPYGLVGICVESDAVELLSIASTAEKGLIDRMERRLADLQVLIDRAGELNEQQTLGLHGGDFEKWGADGQPMGWTMATHPSTSITREHELPRSGESCVRIENRGGGATTAWIQSDRIALPTTGRLALEVWCRTASGQTQPTVRLSLIGRYRDGRRFERWHEFQSSTVATTGANPGSSNTQLNRQMNVPVNGASPGQMSQAIASGNSLLKTDGMTATLAATRDRSQLAVDWGHRPLVLLVPDVPNEDLAELRAAVDLVGVGKLWVDDVRVYGMYLHPEEKVHLLGQMFVAKEKMREGDFTLADQLLGSFWASFLSTYLAPSATAVSADRSQINEARLPVTPGRSGPAWRNPNQPRFNQWQENLRNRWQR